VSRPGLRAVYCVGCRRPLGTGYRDRACAACRREAAAQPSIACLIAERSAEREHRERQC
jgi:hypothetical protein